MLLTYPVDPGAGPLLSDTERGRGVRKRYLVVVDESGSVEGQSLMGPGNPSARIFEWDDSQCRG